MNNLVSSIAANMQNLPESGILDVINYGMGRGNVTPLWVGEGDQPTADIICAAANQSLAAGETFYTYQRGIPALRQALAKYHHRVYGSKEDAESYYVTGSGMQAIQIAVRLVAGPSNQIIVPTPSWPNILAAISVSGAQLKPLPMNFENNDWVLDTGALGKAINKQTSAIFINSPSNPTGWVARREILQEILALARYHGLWIIADEVYSRFYYGSESRAPSFRDIADPDDKILYVNTFSKNWAMTGWRIGWISAPPEIGSSIEHLIQYSTSGVAAFMQRAAVVAIEEGEYLIGQQIERCRASRDILCNAFAESNRIRFTKPEGAFYLYFSVEGWADGKKLAYHLIDEAGLGLAPGYSFGPGGEDFVRLCFALAPEKIQPIAERLVRFLH